MIELTIQELDLVAAGGEGWAQVATSLGTVSAAAGFLSWYAGPTPIGASLATMAVVTGGAAAAITFFNTFPAGGANDIKVVSRQTRQLG
jgi:hypothetical protein